MFFGNALVDQDMKIITKIVKNQNNSSNDGGQTTTITTAAANLFSNDMKIFLHLVLGSVIGSYVWSWSMPPPSFAARIATLNNNK